MIETARLDPLRCALFVITAFVIAGVLQTIWLQSTISRRLAVPLDAGLMFRGRRVFGENKTLRGLAVMVPGAAVIFYMLGSMLETGRSSWSGIWMLGPEQLAVVGAAAGVGFMVGELPNSFIKRQLGIGPGDAPRQSWARVVCFLGDRFDSILGMLASLSLLVPTPWQMWVWVLLLGPAIHWSFSLLLFHLGVKGRPA